MNKCQKSKKLKTRFYLNKINKVLALQFFQIFRFGILLLISIVFTKTNLSLGQIGIYETFLLIAGSVSFFWIGAMQQTLLATYAENKTFGKTTEKSPVLFNISVLFTAFSILSAVFVFLLQPVISGMFSIHGGQIPYMKILFLYIIFSGPVNLVEYAYLLLDKPLRIIYFGVLTFTLQLFCVTLPIIIGFDLGYGLYGLVLVNILRFIWLGFIILKYSKIQLSVKFIQEFLILSAPLVTSFLLSGSAQYIDGFIISYKFDEATLAIFRYGAREVPVYVLLINAFGNAMTPSFAIKDNLKQSLTELKKGTENLMNWMFPTAFFLIISSKYLFPLVFNKNFIESAFVFNIYLLILITRFIFSRIILIGFKDTKPILYSSIVEIIINVALSFALINLWGIYGVAFATFVSYVIEKIILITILNKKYNILLGQYVNVKKLYLFSAILLICWIIGWYI